MIIGFDVDGVIAKAPLGLHRLLGYYQKGWNRLLLNPLGAWIYRKLRYADKETKEIICRLSSQGHPIVIISYALGKGKKELEEWLTKREVPFDKIIEVREGESPLEFKVRAILEQECDYYIEDQPALAQDIALRVPAVKVIHYKQREDLESLPK